MSTQDQKPKKRDKARTEEERRERIRQYCLEHYQKLKQDPEKWAKYIARHRANRNRTEEQKQKYLAYCKKYRERLLEDPESTKKYREKTRMRTRAYMQRIRNDGARWLRFLQLHRKLSRKYYWTRDQESRKRWLQRSIESQARHQQRLENDPHYAHYHKEYAKAKYHERTGKPIDPDQPR